MNRSKNLAAITAACMLLFAACKKSNDGGSQSTPLTFKNQIAYIYRQDSSDGMAYKGLLQANNCGVTLIDMSQIGNIDFKKFGLVVIGNNSSADAYDFASVTGSLKSAGTPLLLIGEGGGHYGEMINAAVNWGSCASFSFPLTMVVVDSSMSVYKSPKKIAIPTDRQLLIFNQSPYGQAFEESPYSKYPNVEFIGQATSANSKAFSVTLESGKYGFWGYYNNINAMTQTGKDFMVNLSYYIGKFSL